jgi:voltage-gated potassium channel
VNEVTRAPADSSQADAALVALLLSLTAGGGEGGGLSYQAVKREILEAVDKDPFDATVVTVFGGAFLFYLAEKGKNPKVESYWDALVFISTCLSVGYHDVFARTPGGKAIATAVMTLGPALSGAVFEGSAADKARAEKERADVQKAIVGTLGEILSELRTARRERSS